MTLSTGQDAPLEGSITPEHYEFIRADLDRNPDDEFWCTFNLDSANK